MELGHTSKIESILYNMIYKYANLQKCAAQEVIVSSVQIELHGSVFSVQIELHGSVSSVQIELHGSSKIVELRHIWLNLS
jgi:hypothetical protein